MLITYQKIDNKDVFTIQHNNGIIIADKEDLEELSNMINAELHEMIINNLSKYDDNKYDYLNKEGE